MHPQKKPCANLKSPAAQRRKEHFANLRFWKIVSQEQDKKAQIFVCAFLRVYPNN
jgi:hypothetical protein